MKFPIYPSKVIIIIIKIYFYENLAKNKMSGIS